MNTLPFPSQPPVFCLVPVDDIIELRRNVLRKEIPHLSPEFPEDRLPDTVHFAAMSEGLAIACLTLFPSTWAGKEAFQLRGMAVDPVWQGKHLGAKLLEFAKTKMMSRSLVRLWWCNARESAVPFYEKQGWKIASEPFVVQSIGNHYKMMIQY